MLESRLLIDSGRFFIIIGEWSDNAIKFYLNTVKAFSTKKTKTDLQDCRVGVTIDMNKHNDHL